MSAHKYARGDRVYMEHRGELITATVGAQLSDGKLREEFPEFWKPGLQPVYIVCWDHAPDYLTLCTEEYLLPGEPHE
jgi:hypothetical protein